MRRAELGDLAAFVEVANALSFRAAAERLRVTPSALSHTIRQVEERHGVRLLNRTTRKVSLTDAGERLLGRLRPALDEITGAVRELDERRERPFGRLAILSVHSAVAAVITPVWARYLTAYPDVQLDLTVDSTPHDIVDEGLDAAVGLVDWATADMVAVRVTGPRRGVFVASPSYLARRGVPRAPDDLARHSCIRLRGQGGSFSEWLTERKGQRGSLSPTGQVVVNDAAVAMQAAVDGLGIVLGAEALAEPWLRSGQLTRVLEAWAPAFEGLYLYYPRQRQVSAALRALIDLIRQPA
ncbi:MAG TPA: LysR family transcriptional regulator [Caulobacteraceae bacterium]